MTVRPIWMFFLIAITLVFFIASCSDEPGDLEGAVQTAAPGRITSEFVSEVTPPSVIADPARAGLQEMARYGVRNTLTLRDLHSAVSGGYRDGLHFDLTGLTITATDGRVIAPSMIYGRVYYGPYPFEDAETGLSYGRLRRSVQVTRGRAVIDAAGLLSEPYNADEWTDSGRLMVRAELYSESQGIDRRLGTFDMLVGFRVNDGLIERATSLMEGPFVSMAGSTEPGSVTVWFTADRASDASIVLDGGPDTVFSASSERHFIHLEGLAPDTEYGYDVLLDGIQVARHRFRTPPLAGEGEFTFAYAGDSRQGVGTGEVALMGVNHQTLSRLTALARNHGAEFFLQGGDLVSGYTSSPDDFRTQLWAWKYTMGGFWHESPVLTALGNHEALLRVFRDDRDNVLEIDRWPYPTESTEAVFGDELVQPLNGPEPSDPRRPAYSENVFIWQWGRVLVICFNDNYWYSSDPTVLGGCPEGYVMRDQLDWIEEQLDSAEVDPTVDYILLMAQEPMFPCGGHAGDAMWYHGDNRVRAYSMVEGRMEPESFGIIEMRNELALAIAASSKVAAVLGADEHAYYRILIDDTVPVGTMGDDSDGDGIIAERGENISPLPLDRPTWYITSGGAGAPYYAEQITPWNAHWKTADPSVYRFSSQENILVFHADAEGISLAVYNSWGERFDEVENLMAVREGH